MANVKFNQKDYKYGLEMEMNVDFIDNGDGTMKILQCTIIRGTQSCDYASVVEDRTLLDIIKEFMRGE